MNIEVLKSKTVPELLDLADEMKIKGARMF
jgi:hypothetical protein